MNIGKFDVMVLVVMSLAIVSISFVFPALGLSDTQEQEENDIPELNITDSRFDFTGERPEFPNTPTEGTMFFNTTRDAAFSENQIWLEGSTSGGVELTLIEDAGNASTAEVILTRWNDSGEVAEQDRVYLDNTTTSGVISVQDYRLTTELGEDNAPPEYYQVEWNVVETGEAGGSFIGRIPLVGAMFGAASDIAAVVAWGITIFIWFSQSLVQGVLNVIGALYDASAYFISLFAWTIDTYGTVVSSAPGWTGIFVAIPGIILSVVLGKFVVIFIGLIPTT